MIREQSCCSGARRPIAISTAATVSNCRIPLRTPQATAPCATRIMAGPTITGTTGEHVADLTQAALHFVQDATVGYVVEKALEPALRPTWAFLKSILLPRWDEGYDEVRRCISDAFREAEKTDKQFFERLQRSLQSGEADALLTRLAREAAQATTDERMRMLAAAAAGVLTPDLDSEMRSRVARALEQLEPSDVLALRKLNAARMKHHNVMQIEGAESTRALLQTGCAYEVPGVGQETRFEMLPLGRAVLRTLKQWKPREGAPR
jgi:hypothetical protein